MRYISFVGFELKHRNLPNICIRLKSINFTSKAFLLNSHHLIIINNYQASHFNFIKIHFLVLSFIQGKCALMNAIWDILSSHAGHAVNYLWFTSKVLLLCCLCLCCALVKSLIKVLIERNDVAVRWLTGISKTAAGLCYARLIEH